MRNKCDIGHNAFLESLKNMCVFMKYVNQKKSWIKNISLSKILEFKIPIVTDLWFEIFNYLFPYEKKNILKERKKEIAFPYI